MGFPSLPRIELQNMFCWIVQRKNVFYALPGLGRAFSLLRPHGNVILVTEVNPFAKREGIGTKEANRCGTFREPEELLHRRDRQL